MLDNALTWDQKLCHEAQAYAQAAFDFDLHLRPLENTGLPRFVGERYALFQGDIVGRPALFMAVRPTRETGGADVIRQRDLVRRQTGIDLVVLLYERLSPRRRHRLIAERVAFMVPQSHIFVPDLVLDLRDRQPAPSEGRASSQAFTPTAQVVILARLLHHDTAGANVTDLANQFGLAPMSLSRAFDEIVQTELADIKRAGRRRELHFRVSGKSLWDAAESRLQSPVRKVRQVIIPEPDLFPGRVAGESALALRTMLAAPRTPRQAVAAADWNRLAREHGLVPADPFDRRADEIETWTYDPGALTTDRVVDPLSLYLSLRHQPDERVAQAAEHLLESLPW
jgi:DNA-binding MarR family transcriptional regulator